MLNSVRLIQLQKPFLHWPNSKDCRVFHAYNPQNVTFADIVRITKDLGLIIEPVEEEEYKIALEDALADKNKQDGITGILTSIGEGYVKKTGFLLKTGILCSYCIV